MNPVAFHFLGLDFRWYGIIIAMGMLLGIMIAWYNCSFRNVYFDHLIDLVLICIPFGIIGARLYYVIFDFSEYKNNLIQVFNIRGGGLAIHGGIIFAFAAAWIYCRRKKLNLLKFADVAAPSIILAQAMGRWGNFFNQEAHGGPVSYNFIKHFPSFIQNGMLIDGTYYHPTFLYESMWNIIIFIILNIILRRSKKVGVVFFTYLGLYSIGRFFIEGLRTDSLMFGPIRVAQLVSLLGIIAWLVFLTLSRSKKFNSEF
ncbi:prolipoprotein diacylglyceryl transferase [Clostridium folliculivorans]|uniref:Phosphatidylglycerol--prolipoprotein diacylglyceryl transferase n=1 Tax=Clostridium folliculivorans TaxID=2886038 RepID=A0A9W6D8L2_9CLOT|nr:prolipoprotein diacylglyceryl transferase [Clostridium folliculivorans]GKU23206.1 prolipoprotein diacylglyceryl transferase [Clostridium folliculivorans]GKU29252.1 prolipoprotein diacylglyceryl transferase [Clostridium folliculivorans]